MPSTGHFATLPVGATLPGEAECAAAVRRTREIRPANATFNAARGADLKPQFGLYARVTGNFTGTTDEIIQWAACKWGIDEDIVRAQVAKESWWYQRPAGTGRPTRTAAPRAPDRRRRHARPVPRVDRADAGPLPLLAAAFPSATTSSAYNVD